MTKRGTARRGVTLVATMLLLLMVLTLVLLSAIPQHSGGVVGAADDTLRYSRRTAYRMTARLLADTGLRLTVQWLTQQRTPLPLNRAFAPSELRDFYGAKTLDGWSVLTLNQAPLASEASGVPSSGGELRVRILPARDDIRVRQLYFIEAEGSYMGQKLACRALVRPTSFAHYGIVYDEPSTGAWTAGLTRLSGPVHMNMRRPGTESVDPGASHTIYWNDTDRIFLYNMPDYFSLSGSRDQVRWLRAGGVAQAPGTSQWPLVAAAGVEPMYAAPLLRFPDDASPARDASLGMASPPSVPGITVDGSGTTDAGIFVQGDVANLSLSAAGAGGINQLMTIDQSNGTQALRTIVTIDRTNGQTRLQRFTAPAPGGTYALQAEELRSGVTNGVLYVNGNIGNTLTKLGGLSGTIANNQMNGLTLGQRSALTIATPPDKTVQLNGGIVYVNLMTGGDATNPISSAIAALPATGTFGLVTGNVHVVEKDAAGRTLTEAGLHGALLAMGEVTTLNYASRPAGRFNFLGSYTVRRQRTMGMFNTTTMTQISGLQTSRTYDPRLGEDPPPAFPETNDFTTLSLQSDVSSLH